MIWPERCYICGPKERVPRKPVIYNPRTGHAFCRKCSDLPGFWRTFWDQKDVASKVIRAVEDTHAK